MASFISAGHHLRDSGAVGSGTQENLEAIKLRDLVVSSLKERHSHVKVITDNDNETLSQYLNRIQTGEGSVVLEIHFDASVNKTATGTTCLVGIDADQYDKDFAKEIVDATASVLKIRNRGVISEAKSHRGRLGLMRERGMVALLEVCFISNPNDMKQYFDNKELLAERIADIIRKYDDKI